MLLCFESSGDGLQVGAVTLDDLSRHKVSGGEDVAAVYNLLFRYLFDWHRDLVLPSSFLIDEQGLIVKVYQGRVDPKKAAEDGRDIPRTGAARMARALPFPGVSETYEFGRNYLSLGSVFFQHGYIEPAEEFFRSALKDDPTSAEAFYGLGSVYLKQAKNAAARECFESTTQLKASYPETEPNAWNNLGLLAAREGDAAKLPGTFSGRCNLIRITLWRLRILATRTGI